MNSTLQWLITFGADVVAAIVGSKLAHDGGKKTAESGKSVILNRVVEKITDDIRNELFIFIVNMEEKMASVNLLKRHAACKGKAAEEDRWVNVMARLYLVVKDDQEKRKIFDKLGLMSEEDFKQALYFLENDVIKQWFDKAKEIILQADTAVAEYFEPAINSLDHYAAENRKQKGFGSRKTKKGEIGI